MLSTIITPFIFLSSLCGAHPGVLANQARALPDSSLIISNATATNSSIPSQALIVSALPYATICPISTVPGAALTNETAISPAADDSANAAVEAHESVGAVSCRTLTTTTEVCSTVLTGMGQLPISVTACDEWVVFSTDTGSGAAATPAAAAAGDTTYYLAPWQTILAGAVPSQVRVENCQGTLPEQNCTAGTEVWSITEIAREAIKTTTVSFQGTVTGVSRPCPPCTLLGTDDPFVQGDTLILGNGAFTTEIPGSIPTLVSISTAVTSTYTQAVPSIVKSSGPQTITITMTTFVSGANTRTTSYTTITVMSTVAATHTAVAG